ncbi:MAG: DNA translocase FtsK [Chloroflexi bacterium]|nr:DNA translocase FtsK [Chloroflexota bacterium]
MSGRHNQRPKKAIKRRQERLRHQLEVQSQQIERILSQHQLSAHIAGGRVQPRSISFDLNAPIAQGWKRLRNLTRELKVALNAPDVRLDREEGQWRLHITRQEEPPVELLDLLPLLPDLPPVTAALGLAEDGRPILLDFDNPDVTHVLVAGQSGAGKTTLLRTLALSLALKNRQSQLQLLVVDSETAHAILEPLSYLPHMLTGISYHLEEAVEILDFLRGEMAYRQQQEATRPMIVVLIDKITHLLETDQGAATDALTELLQHGADVGIHFVLSTRRPDTAALDNLFRASLPVRLVGQVQDEQEANAAAGIAGTQAEYLLGKGDFLAVVGGEATHFQAAYIGDYDLHLCLENLHRNRPQPLLAQRASIRPTLSPETATPDREAPQNFSFDGRAVELDSVRGE